MNDRYLNDKIRASLPSSKNNIIEAVQSDGLSAPQLSEVGSGENLVVKSLEAVVWYIVGSVVGVSLGIVLSGSVILVWYLFPNSAPQNGLSIVGLLFSILVIMGLVGGIVGVEFRARSRRSP